MLGDSIDRIAQGLESLARLNTIEREFMILAVRASALIAAGDIEGARFLMGKMEVLHEEIKGMKQEGTTHAA